MKHINFANDKASTIVLGTMRISDMTVEEVINLLQTAADCGICFIDTADIYGDNRCEELLGQAFSQTHGLREKFFLQSKCGIRKDGGFTWFDFSREHILDSVDGSLKRLKTDHLDVLLLHRPDALMDTTEIAQAFGELEASGKVQNFGVSNMNPAMIELLKATVKQPLIVNQIQLSAAFTPSLDSGFHINMEDDAAIVRASSILEYCRLNDIVIQAWSPLQYGYLEGTFLDNDKYKNLNNVLDRIAKDKGCSKAAIALAWVLKYPGRTQAIIGTTDPNHVKEAAPAMDIELTKHEWYDIYLANNNEMP